MHLSMLVSNIERSINTLAGSCKSMSIARCASRAYTRNSQMENLTRPKWTGAFKIGLKLAPRDLQAGWVIGSRSDMADILLIPTTRRWTDSVRIAAKHASLFLHPESCQLVLQARHTVTTSKTGVEVVRGSTRRVLSQGELFSIQDNTYSIELTDVFGSQTFEEELSSFLKSIHGAQWSMNPLMAPSSTAKPLNIGDYYCSASAFAQGTFGKMSAGWNQQGTAVAIKVFKEPRESEIRSHENLMQYIGRHVNGHFPRA